jgi:(p)ppGpp synthase/HD superfamily hydrolase
MQENSAKNKARDFAVKAHKDQKYGAMPYSVHLDTVAAIVMSYGESAQIIALLHDVVEDTPVTLQDIEVHFGVFIAQCVQILTDEPGENRAIRKSATYQKMAKVEGELALALVVKAADRLANMRASLKGADQRRLSMYHSEYAVFRNSVYRENLCEEIWVQLDTLNREIAQ